MIDQRLDRRYPSVADLREGARRRIPRFAFDYLAGGIGEQHCAQRNLEALRSIRLSPRYLTDADHPCHACSLFGRRYEAPFGVAPMGLIGLVWPHTPRLLAASAAAHGLPFVLSSFATDSLEEVRAVAGDDAWFQLYVPADREVEESLLERARTAGYEVLVVTVDIPTATRRRHDIKNGLSLPPRLNPSTMLQVMTRPLWAWHMLRSPPLSFANLDRYLPAGAGLAGAAAFIARMAGGHITRETLERIRERWPHKLVVKGVLHPDDARVCSDLGCDGVIVSNHGGRQLDAAQTALEALGPIRAAVGPDMPVMADGGVRSGLDIARVLACGADFVWLGRAFGYAVGALGERGPDHVTRILKEELRSSMSQLGCRDLAQLPETRV